MFPPIAFLDRDLKSIGNTEIACAGLNGKDGVGRSRPVRWTQSQRVGIQFLATSFANIGD
jgi:hypothetical protein